MFDRALADLVPAPRRAAVTLTATIQFTARRLLPALGSFRERFPDFDLRLHSSNEPVDLAAGLADVAVRYGPGPFRSEEHTSELQSLMRISYAVFCLKKKTNIKT